MRELVDRIDVYIISGFLGSGKTTLLRELIRRFKRDDGRSVVLENEFGKIDFDGEVLASTGTDVESVVAECICCGGAEAMLDKLRKLKESGVSRLFVEPSGVARLSDLRRILGRPDIREYYELKCVVATVDACNALKWNKISGVLFENQIRFSDVVYVSKRDLATEAQFAEVAGLIKTIKPDAVFADDLSWKIDERGGVADRPRLIYERPGEALEMEACSVMLDRAVSGIGLRLFFESVKTGCWGKIFRVKGTMRLDDGNCYTVDGVADNITMVPTDCNASVWGITFIGTDLKNEMIENELNGLLR